MPLTGANTPSTQKGACDVCRLRKLKCDRKDPSCSRCITDSTPCTYYLFLNLPLPLHIQEFSRSRRLNGIRLARFKLEKPIQQMGDKLEKNKLTIINYSPPNNKNTMNRSALSIKKSSVPSSKANSSFQNALIRTKHTTSSLEINSLTKSKPVQLASERSTYVQPTFIKQIPKVNAYSPPAFFLISELSSSNFFGSFHHPSLLQSYSTLAPLLNAERENEACAQAIDHLVSNNVWDLLIFFFRELNTYHYIVYHKNFFKKFFSNCVDSDFLTLVFAICALTCTLPNPPLQIPSPAQLGSKYYQLALSYLKKCFNKPTLTLFEALYVLVDYEVKCGRSKPNKLRLSDLANLVGLTLGIDKPSMHSESEHRKMAWRIGQLHAHAFSHIMGESTATSMYHTRPTEMKLADLAIEGVLKQEEIELTLMHFNEVSIYFNLVNELDETLDRHGIRRGAQSSSGADQGDGLTVACLKELDELEFKVLKCFGKIHSRLITKRDNTLFYLADDSYFSLNFTLFYITLLIEISKSKAIQNSQLTQLMHTDDVNIILKSEYHQWSPIEKCTKLSQLGLKIICELHLRNFMLLGSDYKWWCFMVIGTQYIYNTKLESAKSIKAKRGLNELMTILEYYENKCTLARSASVPLRMIYSSTSGNRNSS